VYGHSFPHDFWQGRTFVLTSNDHPGHLCSHQMSTPDIRAHINFISFIYSLHAYPLLLIAWSLKKSTKQKYNSKTAFDVSTNVRGGHLMWARMSGVVIWCEHECPALSKIAWERMSVGTNVRDSLKFHQKHWQKH